MAKNKHIVKMKSYGRYTQWDRSSKDLPKILEFTTQITAEIDVEFGYILNIKKAKGEKLSFVIDHPPFNEADGSPSPPFTGEVFITSNDFNFFLGDTIWAPKEDKVGPWKLTTFLNDQIIAEKTLQLTAD